MELSMIILFAPALVALIIGATVIDVTAIVKKDAAIRSTIMFHFFRGLIFLSFMIVGGVFAIPAFLLILGIGIIVGILILVFLTLDWVMGRIRRMFGAARARKRRKPIA